MTKDLNKGISSIQYNVLNLPARMDVLSPVAEARVDYTYSARGQKLRVKQRYNPNYSTSPVIGSAVNEAALTATKTTNYVGRHIFNGISLERIQFEDGYYKSATPSGYQRYIKDYQGNIRTVRDHTGTVVQRTDYFPFGLSISNGGLGAQVQPYKFGGKEEEPMHGLGLLDFHARQYDPVLGRPLTMDPLAEKYPWLSPYAWCLNNPVRNVDPDGRDPKNFQH